MCRFHLWFVLLLGLFGFAGCQSYTIVQRNVFSDEDGNVVQVDYGRSESKHVNTFVSPATGKTMEFRSDLVIEVELPNGKSITCWQCMNFLNSGTMYKTDSEEWMVLVNGFNCVVYHQTEETETLYQEVYNGTLCDSPDIGFEKKNDQWRVLPRTSGKDRK